MNARPSVPKKRTVASWLAAEGMRFTDHYAGSTVCRPSRLVLLTGQHTGHTPISSNAKYWLAPEDLTVTELLKEAGYAPEGIDGISFLPALLGKEQAKHEYLYWQYRGKEAVRAGPWKAVRLGPEKPIELYRLDTDIGEQHDVAKEHPDLVAEMEKQMQQARTPR